MTASNRPSPEARPFAVLSDLHAHLDALDKVLEVLDSLGVQTIFVAGDIASTGPDPLGVWTRLRDREARCVKGLGDSALCSVAPESLKPTNDEEREAAARFVKTRKDLGELVLESIRRLPERLRVPLMDGREMLVVHGSPGDPYQEITQELSDEEILSLLNDDPADLVVCGASHVPFQRVIEDVHVINAGSVGAAPEGRVAHYTIVSPAMSGLTVEQNWVAY